MDCMEILKKLTLHSAVSGNEEKTAQLIHEEMLKFCDSVEVDSFFNVIGVKKGFGEQKRKIMITAHLDEIGFIVSGIDKNGFIRLSSVGGVDGKLMLAQEVVIHGIKDITGIIGAKPPHLLKDNEKKKAVRIEDLSVDTGLSVDHVKKYITIGDIVTLKGYPVSLKGNKFGSKALDNRCGIAALFEIMKRISIINHSYDVIFTATAQEEFELAGATISAYNIKPDIAVVIDACHGDMPDVPKDSIYYLGKGPAVGVGPILNKKLGRKFIDIAKKEYIPYQVDVESGDTGTEAWATQVSRAGIPTALLSIPVRYMHSPSEVVQIDDIVNTSRLVSKLIEISVEEMEEILCF